MSNQFNQLVVRGYVATDTEMRFTDSGTAVCNFSLGTNREWKNGAGEKQTQVTWLRITVWGARAEFVSSYVHKGSHLLVTGSLNPDKETGSPRVYQAQNGEYRASYEVTASNIELLDKQSDNGNGNSDTQPANDDDDFFA